jgi:hypothetical protein
MAVYAAVYLRLYNPVSGIAKFISAFVRSAGRAAPGWSVDQPLI